MASLKERLEQIRTLLDDGYEHEFEVIEDLEYLYGQVVGSMQIVDEKDQALQDLYRELTGPHYRLDPETNRFEELPTNIGRFTPDGYSLGLVVKIKDHAFAITDIGIDRVVFQPISRIVATLKDAERVSKRLEKERGIYVDPTYFNLDDFHFELVPEHEGRLIAEYGFDALVRYYCPRHPKFSKE